MTAGVLVVAKAPVPGLAKTRLAAHVGDDAAADLAAAALLDTLDAGAAFASPGWRMVALTGDLDAAARSAELRARLGEWTVVPQRGATFADRLVGAHRDAAELWGPTAPVVQVGMDTPQLDADDLHRLAEAVTAADRLFDAAIGPADDGGWWALATRRSGYTDGLAGVAMSQPSTGRQTALALTAAGARVCHLHLLRDVDTRADADVVAAAAPHTRFADAWAGLFSGAGR